MTYKLFGKVVGIVIGVIVRIVALSFVLAYPTMWLWNSTMPELFGFKSIGLWMAWKINFLTSILFKGSYTTKT